MANLGHKKIDAKNWNEPDLPSTAFPKEIKDGKIIHWTGEELAEEIMKYKLSENTPEDLRKIFEVTKGAMVYGYYFYPLYTLAHEQLFRVLDASTVFKCRDMKPDKDLKNFNNRIEYLCKVQVIKEKEKERWHAIRRLRNSRSHPDYQMILGPSNALESLKLITDMINGLYK